MMFTDAIPGIGPQLIGPSFGNQYPSYESMYAGATGALGSPFGDPAIPSSGALFSAGLAGIVVGAGLLTLLTSWAFKSHNPDGKHWQPALILGGGALVTGVATLALSGASPGLGMFGVGVMMGK